MGDRDAAQAVELVRALRHQLHEMTTRLARVERQDVTGRKGPRGADGSRRAAPRLSVDCPARSLLVNTRQERDHGESRN